MGWSFATDKQTSKQHIARLIAENSGERHAVVAHKQVGKTLWLVVAMFANGKDKPETSRIIVAILREKHDGCWGEKEMSEDMGPYDSTCPLHFLTLQPKIYNEFSRQFRERVKTYHAVPKPKVGFVYSINSILYELVSVKPLRLKLHGSAGNMVYSVRKSTLRLATKI